MDPLPVRAWLCDRWRDLRSPNLRLRPKIDVPVWIAGLVVLVAAGWFIPTVVAEVTITWKQARLLSRHAWRSSGVWTVLDTHVVQRLGLSSAANGPSGVEVLDGNLLVIDPASCRTSLPWMTATGSETGPSAPSRVHVFSAAGSQPELLEAIKAEAAWCEFGDAGPVKSLTVLVHGPGLESPAMLGETVEIPRNGSIMVRVQFEASPGVPLHDARLDRLEIVSNIPSGRETVAASAVALKPKEPLVWQCGWIESVASGVRFYVRVQGMKATPRGRFALRSAPVYVRLRAELPGRMIAGGFRAALRKMR